MSKYILALMTLILSISVKANDEIIKSLTKEATVSVLETKGDMIHVSVTQWIKKDHPKKKVVILNIKKKVAVEFVGSKEEMKPQDYKRESLPYRKHIRSFVNFKNTSSKVVTGIIYTIEHKDSFNRVLLSASRQDEVNLSPGRTTGYGTYRYYEENNYNNTNNYAKLWQAVTAKTLKTTVKITAVAFKDGTIARYDK